MEESGQLHAPATLPAGKETPIGGWVGPRAGVDAVEKRNLAHAGSNTDRSACSLSLYRLKYLGSFYFRGGW
jgi:hypothetical protein